MKANITGILLLALLGSTAAQAQEAFFPDPGPSTRTRAEVRAELEQARAAGQIDVPGAAFGGYEHWAIGPSTRSRADVVVELQDARSAGQLNAWNDSYGSFAPTPVASSKTREEVKAELARAIAAKTHPGRGERS